MEHRKYLAEIGRKGGKKIGAVKRRGDSSYYKKLAKMKGKNSAKNKTYARRRAH